MVRRFLCASVALHLAGVALLALVYAGFGPALSDDLSVVELEVLPPARPRPVARPITPRVAQPPRRKQSPSVATVRPTKRRSRPRLSKVRRRPVPPKPAVRRVARPLESTSSAVAQPVSDDSKAVEAAVVAEHRASSASSSLGVVDQGPSSSSASSPPAALEPRQRPRAPVLLVGAQPRYPRSARRRRAQGVVLVRARVGSAGRVLQTILARSSGADDLDRAALDAVRAWRFRPASDGTRPVEGWARVPVRFKLNRRTW